MLSLITIAKNEAAPMAKFLRHHQSLFDEMIVVDTGSTDDTVAVAQKNGARVFSFTWCDDFAAARNFSLEQATGKWVMYLDFDEVIAPSDFKRIREAIKGPQTCYMLPQWNYYNQPQHQEWQPVRGRYPKREKGQLGFFVADQYRLFPTGLGLEWHGRVHEDLALSVKAAGFKPEALDVPIHHYGYVEGEERNAGRNEMYGKLVRKKLEDDPNDWKAILELAYILVQENEGRQAIPMLEKLVANGPEGPVLSRAQIMLASLYNADHRPDDAITVLHETVVANPTWLFGWTDLIKLLIEGGHWEQADAGMAVAKETFGEDPLLLKLECQLLIKTKRIVEAIPVARRVAVLMPGMQEFNNLADKCEVLARKEGLI